MKKKISQFLKIMMMIMISIVSLGMNDIYGATSNGTARIKEFTGYTITDTQSTHGGVNGLSMKEAKRDGSSSWSTAFCVQPSEGTFHSNLTYTVSADKRKELGQCAYLGWYSLTSSAQTNKQYINVQAYIYQLLGRNITKVTTGNWDSFKADMAIKLKNFEVRPSFNATTLSLDLGETKTITDTKGVLKDYKTFTMVKDGVTVKHTSGSNNMTITVSKNCTANHISFTDAYAQAASAYKWESQSDANWLFTHSTNQNVEIFGNVDPVLVNFNVDINQYSLKIAKVDENQTPVPHTKFQISYDKTMSSIIDTYTTGEDGTITINNLTQPTVYVQEIDVPSHLILDSSIHQVTLKANEMVTFKQTNTLKRGGFQIQKIDESTQKAIHIKGIEFKVYYATNNQLLGTIETDENGIAKMNNILFGDYYLLETKAPSGYIQSHDKIPFTIKDSNTILSFKVQNTPTKVDVSKTDITGEKELPGNHLEVRDENDTVIDSWISNEKPHRIEQLTIGKTYTLVETKPADGYTTASSIHFTIQDTGEVQKVIMKNDITKVDISKTDMTGSKELPGNHLEVRDENGTVIDSWISNEKPHRIEQLIIGKTYTLVETKPADGYKKAEDISFIVEDTNEVQTIVMKNIPEEKVVKTDDTSYFGIYVFTGLCAYMCLNVLLKRKRD